MRSMIVPALVAAMTLTGFNPTVAQTDPAQKGNVRIVTVGPTGGSLDLIARTLAQGFQEAAGQFAYVENRPGASGNIGVAEVVRSKPNGLTIGIITNGTHGVNAALFGKDLPYDPIRDFEPISLLLVFKFVLVVSPTLPVSNIEEFAKYVKQNPDRVSYASAGPGSAMHMSAELFNVIAGLKMTHVPYTGTAKALSMVMSNEVQAMFSPIAEATEHIRTGRLRALAVTSKERSDQLPNISTIAEQGYPDYDFAAWIGLAAPRGTTRETIDRYNKAVHRILSMPDIQERLRNVGMEIRMSTPDELSKLIRSEVAKWPPIVEATGIKAQ